MNLSMVTRWQTNLEVWKLRFHHFLDDLAIEDGDFFLSNNGSSKAKNLSFSIAKPTYKHGE